MLCFLRNALLEKCIFLSNILFNIIVYFFLYSAQCSNVLIIIGRPKRIKYKSNYYCITGYYKLVVAVVVAVVVVVLRNQSLYIPNLSQISGSDKLLEKLGTCGLQCFSPSLPLSPIQLINVLTNDGHKLFEAVLFGSFALCSPVLLIVCIVYACYVLGYTALTGIFTYIIFIPVQVCSLEIAHIVHT